MAKPSAEQLELWLARLDSVGPYWTRQRREQIITAWKMGDVDISRGCLWIRGPEREWIKMLGPGSGLQPEPKRPSGADEPEVATPADFGVHESPYPWVHSPEADPAEGYDPDQGREIGLWERGQPFSW